MIPVLREKIDRSLWTLDTAGSQAGPRLAPSALVGPVPVWNSPNRPV
jgi:hypothetical protein